MPPDRRLIVHPACDLAYASFVVEGLAQLLGADSLEYSTEGFPRRYAGGRTFACYRADDPSRRCFLVFTDRTTVSNAGRTWARVYGMVNVEPDAGGDVVPLGPTFGVRLSSGALTRRHLVHTWRWAVEGGPTEPARRLRVRAAAAHTRTLWKHQRTRARANEYVTRPSVADYVFFTAWPWAKHPEVNPPRVRFIEACKRAPGLTFEGGFAPRRRGDVPDVLGVSAPRRYSLTEYIENVGRSAVAFNNPAVFGCLGWKLGEFLAMGKAIISLPLNRALPAPLEHGVHLHLVDGSPQSLDDALDRLRTDHGYRRSLETNARRWYDEHLAPQQLAGRLLQLLDQ
jgi:hypothetical protein